MTLPPEQLLPFLASVAAGFLMLQSGMRTRTLELRRVRRRCPSCDRSFEGAVCSHCAGDV
jgi:hypothetical protein